MKNALFTKISLGCLLGLLAIMTGCCIQIGCGIPLAKYEKTIQLSKPLSPKSILVAETRNGSITVMGGDVGDCNVVATIIARAGSEEDARRLADQTKIKLERIVNKLTAKIEKPITTCNESVAVNLNITVPRQTSVDLKTRNGTVTISQINGNINSVTRNGNITLREIHDNMKIETRNGNITCENISGDIRASTRNGNVNVTYSANAKPICDVLIATRNGKIDFTPPQGFSASAEISTHNGSIQTNLPLTVTGRIDKSLKGKIGTGEGRLHLKTRNGSIRIR